MIDDDRNECTCGHKLSVLLTPDPDSGFNLCAGCGRRIEKLDLNRYWYGQRIKWYLMSGNRSKIPADLKVYDPTVDYKNPGKNLV